MFDKDDKKQNNEKSKSQPVALKADKKESKEQEFFY
jgi:hypothetical protein